MTRQRIAITACGILTPLGRGKAENARNLFAGYTDGLNETRSLISGREAFVGAVPGPLSPLLLPLQDLDSRNTRLMALALAEIAAPVQDAIARYGAGRIAVVMGSSTSGIEAGETAFAAYLKTGTWPAGFHYRRQELTALSAFVARTFAVTGPAYTVATACSSSAKVFASARRLIVAGIADAVLAGGADSLCRMTLNGFDALELVSHSRCRPFSVHRDGITIGEGASAFLLERAEDAVQPCPVELLGVGETSDAHHMTAPEPTGAWAAAAMRQALEEAELTPDDIAYVNLHGTGTGLNDAMEAHAIAPLFGKDVPVSSTKGMTGHMLGATGGCEAAFLWLTLHPAYNPDGQVPPHIWDGAVDPALPALHFATVGETVPIGRKSALLSNSFGFGGSNAALILGAPS